MMKGRSLVMGILHIAVCIGMSMQASCSSPDNLSRKEISEYYSFIGDNTKFRQKLLELDVKDGIEAQEACLLAYIYFEKYNGYCGYAELSQHTPNEWLFYTAVGRNGTKAPPIRINKKTGIIQQKGNPKSAAPWPDLNKYIKDAYHFEMPSRPH